jgi:hypothetical protein
VFDKLEVDLAKRCRPAGTKGSRSVPGLRYAPARLEHNDLFEPAKAKLNATNNSGGAGRISNGEIYCVA